MNSGINSSNWWRSLTSLGRRVLNEVLAETGQAAPRARRSKTANPISTPGTVAQPTMHAGGGSANWSGTTAVEVDVKRALQHLSYSPEPDGHADPGEVVWAWVPYDDDPTRGKDRPVLVLGRHQGRLLVATMSSKDHDDYRDYERSQGRTWMDLGTGAWDSQGRESEVRTDRILAVSPHKVRREGATLDRARFEAVVEAIRRAHHLR